MAGFDQHSGNPHLHYGDFNVVLRAHKQSSGILTHNLPSEDFQNFIEHKDLFDIEVVGNKYTWLRIIIMELSLLG